MRPSIFFRALVGVSLLFCMLRGVIASPLPNPTNASKTDRDQITETLLDYIVGTANGEPDRLKKAFHPDFKLYAVTDAKELLIRSGTQYIADIKTGEKNSRVGRILSIDVENDVATAKAEILIPGFRIYTDYFMLVKYQNNWKIVQKSYTWKEVPKQRNRVLFVTSNQHTYGNTNINTANHFQEIVIAYDVFMKNGYAVDFVSPHGGAIPLGYIETSDKTQKEHLYNAEFMDRLENTLSPSMINPGEYKAIYYSGGGSAMFGVAENENIQAIAGKIYEQGGIISAICHGTAGIANLKNKDGAYIIANKKITGFPDMFEDTQAEYYKTFPFSIDKQITKNGGRFVYEKSWASRFYVADGNIITGQDPSATASVAQKVIDTLQGKSQ